MLHVVCVCACVFYDLVFGRCISGRRHLGVRSFVIAEGNAHLIMHEFNSKSMGKILCGSFSLRAVRDKLVFCNVFAPSLYAYLSVVCVNRCCYSICACAL